MARRSETVHLGPVKMRFTLDSGASEIALNRFAERLDDFRRFWIEFWGPEFFNTIQQNFASQGGLVGGWRALSAAYAAWKLAHYGRRPILVASGAMRESFRMGARRNVFKAQKLRVEAGSDDPKVPRHQGGLGVPRRQIVVMLKNAVVKRLLGEYVRQEMSASGLNVRRA